MTLKAAHVFKSGPGGKCRFVYAGDMGESLGPCDGALEGHAHAPNLSDWEFRPRLDGLQCSDCGTSWPCQSVSVGPS